MECKLASNIFSGVVLMELIDTLWNVNMDANRYKQRYVPRINRYIMKCKFSTSAHRNFRYWELIDTLWNVNGNTRDIREGELSELIDTLWNVNAEVYNCRCTQRTN